MTGEQENAVNYAKALSDAWTAFVDKHKVDAWTAFVDKHKVINSSDKIGKAFMAGWITGLGSLSEDK